MAALDVHPGFGLVLAQLIVMQRRSGRPVVRVGVGIPAGFERRGLAPAIEATLATVQADCPDLEFTTITGDQLRLLTVDFELVEGVQ